MVLMKRGDGGGILTWMLVLELGEVVDILVYDDPEVVRLVMRRDIAGCEGFRHVALYERICFDGVLRPMQRREQRTQQAEG